MDKDKHNDEFYWLLTVVILVFLATCIVYVVTDAIRQVTLAHIAAGHILRDGEWVKR